MNPISPRATSFVPPSISSMPSWAFNNCSFQAEDLIGGVARWRARASDLPLSYHYRTSSRAPTVSTTKKLIIAKSMDEETPEISTKESVPLFSVKNLPNILTWLRVVAIPVIVMLFYSDLQHKYLWSAVLFALAGITDFLDGKIARALVSLNMKVAK